jgi:hypothetical protein
MQKQNIFTIEGILYSKRTQPWSNDKGQGEIYYIMLESTRTYTYRDKKTGIEETKTSSDMPEFKLRAGLGFDEYEIGKPIEVTFSLRGKERSWKDKITGQTVKKHITEVEAIYLKAMPIESSRDNKSNVTLAKDVKLPKEADIFQPASPFDDDDSDLPF